LTLRARALSSSPQRTTSQPTAHGGRRCVLRRRRYSGACGRTSAGHTAHTPCTHALVSPPRLTHSTRRRTLHCMRAVCFTDSHPRLTRRASTLHCTPATFPPSHPRLTHSARALSTVCVRSTDTHGSHTACTHSLYCCCACALLTAACAHRVGIQVFTRRAKRFRVFVLDPLQVGQHS
jgi:hypothetical protein